VKFFQFVLHVVISFFMTACSVQSTPDISHSLMHKNPPWLSNPYCDNDKYAAVGCCAPHINGEAVQKKLAISRAIDAIATQIKVHVRSVTLREERNSKTSHFSNTTSKSQQTVDNIAISTQIKAIYKKENGDICAWVVSK